MSKNSQKGFTLVEIILAMALFSFVLTMAIAGFVQINRSYNKGVTVKRVHEIGRNVMEDMARTVRTYDPETTIEICPGDATCTGGAGGVHRLCLGNVRYGWSLVTDGWTLTDNSSVEKLGGVGNNELWLVKDTNYTSCEDEFLKTTAQTFLDENVIVQSLDVTRVGSRAYKIDLTLSTRTDTTDLLESTGTDALCKGTVQNGSQYCDTVSLSTTVSLRN